MRVIDLLNKIADGENPPKAIKINDKYYEYSGNAKNIYSYKEMDKKNKHCLEDSDLLNAEVEVIEEDKKIEKLNIEDDGNTITLFSRNENEWTILNNVDVIICDKINEIIDKINKGE